jgi:hypothetical protein
MQAGLELWARPAGAGHVLLASPLKRTQDNASRPSRACRTLGRFRTRLCNRRIDKEDRRSDAARLFLRRNRVFGTHTHSNLGSPKGTAAKVNCEERRDFRRPSSPGGLSGCCTRISRSPTRRRRGSSSSLGCGAKGCTRTCGDGRSRNGVTDATTSQTVARGTLSHWPGLASEPRQPTTHAHEGFVRRFGTNIPVAL